MRVAANDGHLAHWKEYTDHLTPEDMDVIEAFDRIEPIGFRPVARILAFIAASLAQSFGDKDAHPSDYWPEDEKQDDKPVTSNQAIDLMRARTGG